MPTFSSKCNNARWLLSRSDQLSPEAEILREFILFIYIHSELRYNLTSQNIPITIHDQRWLIKSREIGITTTGRKIERIKMAENIRSMIKDLTDKVGNLVASFDIGGKLEIHASGKTIRWLKINRNAWQKGSVMVETSGNSRTIARTLEQLYEYFRGVRGFFQLAVDISQMTEFQKRVLEVVNSIPYGATASYQQVAEMAGYPLAARAAGQAVGSNPVTILIPCHRVVRKNGQLGGFGCGIDLKEKLLRLETEATPLRGCKSTKIFCRLGCSSGRITKAENVVFFQNEEEAFAAGFRPCKICRPTDDWQNVAIKK